MTRTSYTAAEYRQFKRLIEATEAKGFDNAARVIARIDLKFFWNKVGRQKCNAMWADLLARSKKPK